MHSLYGEQLLLPRRCRFQEGQGCLAPGSPGPSEEPGRTWRGGWVRQASEGVAFTYCHLAWILGVLTFVKKLVSSREPKIRYPARLTGSRTGTVSIAAPRERPRPRLSGCRGVREAEGPAALSSRTHACTAAPRAPARMAGVDPLWQPGPSSRIGTRGTPRATHLQILIYAANISPTCAQRSSGPSSTLLVSESRQTTGSWEKPPLCPHVSAHCGPHWRNAQEKPPG